MYTDLPWVFFAIALDPFLVLAALLDRAVSIPESESPARKQRTKAKLTVNPLPRSVVLYSVV